MTACDGLGELFFVPDSAHDTAADLARTAARQLCATCTAAPACLAHALEQRERAGIWGGLTTAERDQLVRHLRTRSKENPT